MVGTGTSWSSDSTLIVALPFGVGVANETSLLSLAFHSLRRLRTGRVSPRVFRNFEARFSSPLEGIIFVASANVLLESIMSHKSTSFLFHHSRAPSSQSYMECFIVLELIYFALPLVFPALPDYLMTLQI